jgi:hypothetical protein
MLTDVTRALPSPLGLSTFLERESQSDTRRCTREEGEKGDLIVDIEAKIFITNSIFDDLFFSGFLLLLLFEEMRQREGALGERKETRDASTAEDSGARMIYEKRMERKEGERGQKMMTSERQYIPP